MHSPSTPFLTRLAVSDDVANALVDVDDALYAAFLNAVAFAEDVLPNFLLCLDEAEALLVMLEDVGLIVCFDKRQERYFVTAVIFGDGDSPNPGGMNLINKRDVRSLVENVLLTSGLPSCVATEKTITNHVLARSIDLTPREVAATLSDAPGQGLRRFADFGDFTERGSLLRSVDFGGHNTMGQQYPGPQAFPLGHRVDTVTGRPRNWRCGYEVSDSGRSMTGNPGPVAPGC